MAASITESLQLFDTSVPPPGVVRTPQTSLLADTGSDELKVWAMQDLGFQATSHITGEPNDGGDALRRLAEVSGNFPSLARWLSKLPVPDKLRKQVKKTQSYVCRELWTGIPAQT